MNDKRTIWLIVGLVSGYITLQLVADVAAAKIIDAWGLTLPAGTFVFALTFTWRDMLHKRLGKEWARAAIVTAALCNLAMVLYFLFAISLPPAVFWENQDAFDATLGITWRIALASIVAEVVSELLDTEVYHVLVQRVPSRHQYLRVLGSNIVSLPVDSFIFATLAFGGTMGMSALWSVIKGQIVFKAIVTAISLPGIYTVPERPLIAEAVSFEK
ncbi:MAG TPA: queuosine precursor transporter [Bellilinea sp.]|nr:queuosine precursor transporter [Bellilinea sp.]